MSDKRIVNCLNTASKASALLMKTLFTASALFIIAIAVVVENAGFGSMWACPIAMLCIEQYLYGEITQTALFNRMKTSVLNPEVKNYEMLAND